MDVHPATFPADLALVRNLFREYANGLGIDLSFQNFDKEVANLPGAYLAPAGGIWLASEGDDIAGCIALRPLVARTSEMKRLFVRPAYRGRGVGRLLAEQCLAAAVDAGYQRVCLDTLPSMGNAIELYRSLGFVEIEAYCPNPVEGAMFFAKELA